MTHDVDADSIRLMVNTFYGRVQQDPILGPIFEARVAGRWPEHLDKMVGFWRAALLHEPTYSGNPRSVHARLEGVGPDHFGRWLSLFAETTDEIFPSEIAAIIQERARMMARGLLAARGFSRHDLAMLAGEGS